MSGSSDKTLDWWRPYRLWNAKKLRNSIEPRYFDWKRLAKYSFWISIACFVFAVGAIISNDAFIRFLEYIFTSSQWFLFSFFSVLSALFYFWGFRRKKSILLKDLVMRWLFSWVFFYSDIFEFFSYNNGLEGASNFSSRFISYDCVWVYWY